MGAEPSDHPYSLFVVVFFCFILVKKGGGSQIFWVAVSGYFPSFVLKGDVDHIVTWKILEKAQPYSPTTGKCNLCTTEKARIAFTRPSLNKRRELFSTCPHRRKYLLSNLRPEPTVQQARSGSAPRPREEDGCKMAVRNRTVEATFVHEKM